MTRSMTWSLAAIALVSIACACPARADSASDTCEVRREGDRNTESSGPCTFSQRQGYIDLDLKNGNSFSLSPNGKPDHFKDQKGQAVVRTQAGGDREAFKWDNGKHVIVTFGGAGSGAAAELRDEFGTVCGVMTDGKDYRYRCTATDVYAGSQKIRTVLRYQDQTIELTWRPGSRVGLQFEGMVPKEARYSTSEGETNFVFEGKTYFYYSNKDMARMELQNLRD